MELTVIQALIIAIWVALIESRCLGYATLTLRFSPLMTGFICGVVMGDVAGAMKVTATIQLIYMGAVAPGGTLPSEPAIAAAISVPVALIGGLSPNQAVAIAVPVGLLGSYLYQFRFFLNTFFTKIMDKNAAEANSRGLSLSIMLIPTIISFCLFMASCAGFIFMERVPTEIKVFLGIMVILMLFMEIHLIMEMKKKKLLYRMDDQGITDYTNPENQVHIQWTEVGKIETVVNNTSLQIGILGMGIADDEKEMGEALKKNLKER